MNLRIPRDDANKPFYSGSETCTCGHTVDDHDEFGQCWHENECGQPCECDQFEEEDPDFD